MGDFSNRTTASIADPHMNKSSLNLASPVDSQQWIERDANAVWHGFTQMASLRMNMPIVVDRAEGHYLIDVDGKRYLDAISSLWVNTLGHRVKELDNALIAQLDKIAHSTLLGNTNTVVVELCEALAKLVPVEQPHFLFASDGASALEQALKIAFQYWINIGEPEHKQFLALGDAYHGDTIGSLSLSDKSVFNEAFSPLAFPVLRTPGYSDPDWVSKALYEIGSNSKNLAAVVIEPLVQGASGMICAEPNDVSRLGNACSDLGIILICDEVATGFGRTGTLFASQKCNLKPDILCLGKGITGGYLPMSATVVSNKIFEAFLGEDLGPRSFYHGHSYGGNALAAAVAKEHLRLIDSWNVLDNVNVRTQQFNSLLNKVIRPLEGVASIRQHGLMIGVVLDSGSMESNLGRLVCAKAVRAGVLLRPLGDVVVIMPPLTILESEVVQIIEILKNAINSVICK